MAFDADVLDEFAGSFAQALFAEHPDWVEFSRAETVEGKAPDLVVEVPSPHSGDSPKLTIYTENSEITVCFDFYHRHFDWPTLDQDSSLNPLTFIAKVLREDVAAVSAWNDGQWAGSWLINRDERIAPPENFPPMKTIRIRSWNGRLDQDLAVTRSKDPHL